MYNSISLSIAHGSMEEYNSLSEEDKKKFHQIEAIKEKKFYRSM